MSFENSDDRVGGISPRAENGTAGTRDILVGSRGRPARVSAKVVGSLLCVPIRLLLIASMVDGECAGLKLGMLAMAASCNSVSLHFFQR